jgi:hypothetical protein
MVKVQHCFVHNGGLFLRFLAKLEYFLKILVQRLKDFTKKNKKKSNTFNALVQKIQLDEHGKYRYYFMFVTMNTLSKIYNSIEIQKKNHLIMIN